MKKFWFLFALFTAFGYGQNSQAQSPFGMPTGSKLWNAAWIAVPNDNGTTYGVFQFRKNISLAAKPASFIIHVSADNRYKLYVNGKLVSLGPARGDTYFWNFETVDVSPYLEQGDNSIAALVWNEAQYRPEAQITVRTAFILQGNSPAEEGVNTDTSWRCREDKSYQPLWGYFAASTGEMVNMNYTLTNWMTGEIKNTNWLPANRIDNGHLKGTSDGFGWMLVPSTLPQMERTDQRIPLLRKAEGMQVPASFPARKTAVTIPANTTVTMLLDQTFETNAYIHLLFSRGKDAGISIGYAESLYDNIAQYGMRKSNRNDIEGKDFSGRKDSILSNGSNGQWYTTLYWRTFRYLRLLVHTRDEPLVIDDLYGTFTGYPFEQNASIQTSKKEIQQILDIGWRSARLNAMETYFDCPYYEQLQYIGDTRIQAMISYYNSGDDRLARNALNLMDHSRLPEGVTLSRYPTHSTQVISTFSLWYIGMLYDYWMYRPDSLFIKDKLVGARSILDFFSQFQQPDGTLAHTPYWTFVDWANGSNWFVGSPPKDSSGGSAILDLQLLWAYQWAAAMEAKIGLAVYAKKDAEKATQLQQSIRKKYWDNSKHLFADTKDKQQFSQHTNALAILTGTANTAELPLLCNKLLTDSTLTQCTIYFRYYLHQALVKGGLGDHYGEWLDVWRHNIAMGLTTWAEESNLQTTRSDCHAWGASPNIEYYRTVLGIDSDAPGFGNIKIEPHLGDLTNISGEMPHPNGKIAVSYLLDGRKWNIRIHLPPHTPGSFAWKGKTYALHPGDNLFAL